MVSSLGACHTRLGLTLFFSFPLQPKTAPDIGFFGVIKEANSLFYLLQVRATQSA